MHRIVRPVSADGVFLRMLLDDPVQYSMWWLAMITSNEASEKGICWMSRPAVVKWGYTGRICDWAVRIMPGEKISQAHPPFRMNTVKILTSQHTRTAADFEYAA